MVPAGGQLAHLDGAIEESLMKALLSGGWGRGGAGKGVPKSSTSWKPSPSGAEGARGRGGSAVSMHVPRSWAAPGQG